MKFSKNTRIAAAIMFWVMLFNTLPLSMMVNADDALTQYGIGIVNTAHTSKAGDYNSYKVEFYYDDNGTTQLMETIPAITDGGLNIDNRGYFTVAKNDSVNLLDSPTIRTLIEENNITQVKITFRPTEDTSNPKDYHLYSASAGTRAVKDGEEAVVYTLRKKVPKLDENDQPVVNMITTADGEIEYEIVMEDRPLTDSDYTLSKFVSTEMFEHEVDIHWHDTSVNYRPTIDSIAIMQDLETYNVAITSDSPVSVNSNHDIYKYSVPKYDPEGNDYTYTSGELIFKENGKEYRLESDGENNRYDFYSKKSFDFSIVWHQGTANVVTQSEEDIKKYITKNFDLFEETAPVLDVNGKPTYDEDGNPVYQKFDIDSDRIKVTPVTDGDGNPTGEVRISISGFDEILDDGDVGRARVYYLQKKKDASFPVENGEEGDEWKVTVENIGVYSSNLTKVYRDAVISNVITGTTTFDVIIDWKDGTAEDVAARETVVNPGNIVLWRYANVTGNDTDVDRERTAQAAVVSLVETDADGNVIYVDKNGNPAHAGDEGARPKYRDVIRFDNLEKYDRFGNPYIYYAKETITASELSNYHAAYFEKISDDPETWQPDIYAQDGGKIINTRAGTRDIVVEAEWKAAARQGGTASVTYAVQKAIKDKNGNITGWEFVKTPKINEDGIIETDDDGNEITVDGITVDNFKAETMKQIVRFGPLPQYDDVTGEEIVYRVVHTNITRSDNDNEGVVSDPQYDDTSVSPYQDPKPIEINGDTYKVSVENPANTDFFKFTYLLTGNMPLKLQKLWDDTAFHSKYPNAALPSHDNHTVEALVKQFDFEQNKYVTYTVSEGDQDYTHYDSTKQVFDIKKGNWISSTSATQTWEITIHVPMYDDKGHEYQYDVTENNPNSFNVSSGSYYMRVHYTPKDPNDANSADTYVISNIYSEGPSSTLVFRKEWRDDGDLLHRKPIDIHFDEDLNGTAGSTSLSDTNVWEEHVSRYEDYVYNSDDFWESGEGDLGYTTIATIKNEYPLTVTFNKLNTEGTYKVSQKRGTSWIELTQSKPEEGGTISVNLTKKTALKLEQQITDENGVDTWEIVSGIKPEYDSNDAEAVYLSYSGNIDGVLPVFSINGDNTISIRYSGQTVYTLKDSTERPTGYEWINQVLTSRYNISGADTRVVDMSSQKIVKFDNLVAVYQDGDHYYAVEQEHSGDGSVKFTNTRVGVVSYKVELDWCLGDWVLDNESENKLVEVEITGSVNGHPLKDSENKDVVITEKLPISTAVKYGYLTNLPKYDGEGKIIDWQIKEITLADVPITSGSCTLDEKTCIVTMTDPSYTYGMKELENGEEVSDSHSDDLIFVKITNRFEGTTDATVNKMWYDDNNALELRSDTYLQLFYRSHGGAWTQLGGDYVWSASDLTEWSYTFKDLNEFDEKGYPYEYAIKELDINDYSTSTYKSETDYKNGTEGTVTGEGLGSGNFVPSGGWFVDRLYGEVNIGGPKTWQNVSTTYDGSHYPIANLEMYRQKKYITVQGSDFTEANGSYVFTKTINGVPKGNYKAVAVDSGITVTSGESVVANDNGSFDVTFAADASFEGEKRFKLQYKDDNDQWHDTFGVVTTAADTTNIGKTSIYNGDHEYVFKQDADINHESPYDQNTTYTHEIKDGYYIANADGSPLMRKIKINGKTFESMTLPKYDENGVMLAYGLNEEAIRGYVFEISNDGIINDYNGGRPLEITVTKKWEHMNNVEYPNVELTLHQIVFAKTMEPDGTDFIKDDKGNYIITPVEYDTYKKVLIRGEENCEVPENPENPNDPVIWTYTFGKLNDDGTRVNSKEDIRQFAPDGSCFAYYVTEKLISNDVESAYLNAEVDDDGNVTFLGDFFDAVSIQAAIYDDGSESNLSAYSIYPVRAEGQGFKVTQLDQPAEITDEYTLETKNEKIERNAIITNSYEPSEANFKGKLVVNKTWFNYDTDTENENELNTADFETVKDYSFTVSRLTKTKTGKTSIPEVEMFKVDTSTKQNGKPTVTTIRDDYFHFNITTEMTEHRPDEQDPDHYFYEVMKLKKDNYAALGEINITIKIHKREPTDPDYETMHNKVEIDGLAIYAQDAIRYTYKINEDLTTLNAYKNKKNPLSDKMEDVEEDGKTVTKREFTLENELKVFDLKLYKVFGKQYFDKATSQPKTAILSGDDYHQYFNDAFVTQLKFTLYRKEGADGEYKKYLYKYEDGDPDDHIYSVAKTSNSGDLRYSKVFRNLPMYSSDGDKYYYKIEEEEPGVNDHYFILYTNDRKTNGSSSPVDIYVTDDDTKELSTYVRNVFEAKQIKVNKYWDDGDNADGMRPDSITVNIDEHIPPYRIDEDNEIPATDEDIVRVLNIGDLQPEHNWTKVIELPKYYYNGAIPISGLKYGIAEDLTKLPDVYDKQPTYTYMIGKNGMLQTKVLNSGTSVAVAEGSGSELTELEALSVYNSKTLVNSKLTFDKQWSDLDNKWGLRPDHIYVKLTRDEKDLVTRTKLGNFNIPGTMAEPNSKTGKKELNVKIRNLPADKEEDMEKYTVQQQMVTNVDGDYVISWVNLNTVESATVRKSLEKGEEGVFLIDFTVPVSDETMVQKFRIIDTTADESDNVVKDGKDGKSLVAIVNDNSGHNTVELDNFGNTIGAKDKATPFAVSNGIITVDTSKAVDKKVGVLAEGLAKYSDTSYIYHVWTSDDSNFTNLTEITDHEFIIQNDTGRNTVSLTAKNTGEQTAYFKLKRSSGENGTQTDAGFEFEVTGGELNKTTGVITVGAGKSVLIEELPQMCAYEYKVYDADNNTALTSTVRATADSSKVDVLTVLDAAGAAEEKHLKITRSIDGAEELVTDVTAYRFFAANEAGAVAVPVDTDKTSNSAENNPNVVFENLAYGHTDESGTWRPYYYTTVECDKYGGDADSRLTSTQEAKNTDTDRKETASVNLEFKIDVSSYQGGTDPRKHINIKVMCGGQIVKKDINNKPLKVSVDGVEFYASNKSSTIPYEGVIVIPVTPREGKTEIDCVVYDLPYAPYAEPGAWGTPYAYSVFRCNSKGEVKDSYSGFQAIGLKTVPNKTPANTKVTFTKTWSEEAKEEGLIPDYLHLALYRSIAGVDDSEELVDGTSYKNIPIIQNELHSTDSDDDKNLEYYYTYTIDPPSDPLPAGKIVGYSDSGMTNHTGDTGIWRKYTYYFKEYYKEPLSTDNEKSASVAYEPYAQTKGTDKPFTLTNNNTEATLSEGIKNTLSPTSHDVSKEWKDNDEEEKNSRTDYYIALQRREGIQNDWEYVDLNNATIKKVIKSDDTETDTEYNGEISTVGTSTTEQYTILKVGKDDLHIRFDDLPYCAGNGAPYQYRAKEVQIGENKNVADDKTYLFLVPGTEPTDEEYSYVRVIRRGTLNYYVNYNYDSTDTHFEDPDYDYSSTDTTKIDNEIIKDSVTFSHIEVKKVWDDEKNLYGKRPEKIQYVLTRTKNGKPDDDFYSPPVDADETNNWKCEWNQLAAFAADGERFEYFVQELPVANYDSTDSESSERNSDGEIVKTITFTNTYRPEKKTVTASKQWNDDSDLYKLRPQNVTYELYCKYDVYEFEDTSDGNSKTVRNYTPNGTYSGPVYDTSTGFESEVYKAMKAENPNLYSTVFRRELPANGQYEVSFGDLPAWINPSANDRFNGKSVEVTYYIVEKFENKEYVKSDFYDFTAPPMEEGKTADASLRISGLPKADSNNNVYLYEAVEYDGNGEGAAVTGNKLEVSAVDVENGSTKVDLTVTKHGAGSGDNIYFKLICKTSCDDKYRRIYNCEASNKIDESAEKNTPGTSKNTWVLENGLVYYDTDCEQNGYYTLPSSITVNNTRRVLIHGLPYYDSDGNVYEYTVQEFDSTTGAKNSTHSLSCDQSKFTAYDRVKESEKMVVESKEMQDKIDLIITAKNVTETDDDIYFKIICKKTVKNKSFVTDFTDLTYDPNDTVIENNMFKITANSGVIDQDGNAVIHIYGLPKNGEPTEYEAVEYDILVDDDVTEAIALSLDDDRKMKVVSTDSADNTKVDLTVTKPGAVVDRNIYFKLRSITSHEYDVTAQIMQGKTAHPFFICSANETPVYPDGLTAENFDSDIYKYDILTENNIFCFTAEKNVNSFVIKNLPKKDPVYGYNYSYTIEKYDGYSSSAKAITGNNATITPSVDDLQTPGNVDLTVDTGLSENGKLYFKVKRSIVHTQADGLGTATVLKSEADNASSASITNSLNTRNITVALDWNDNDYLKNKTSESAGHTGEPAVRELHYNTEINLKCDSLKVKVPDPNDPTTYTDSDYSEKKTITVLNKEEVDEKRTYEIQYGVVFKNLPKYDSNGDPYEYKIDQKIAAAAPDSDVYRYQRVNAYTDIQTNTQAKFLEKENCDYLGTDIDEKSNSNHSLVDVVDGDNNLQGRKYGYGTTYTTYTDNSDNADYVTQYNILNTLPLTAVDVVKHWADTNNKFDLRPNMPADIADDPLGLVLETTTDDDWTDVDYSVETVVTDTDTDSAGNDRWVYTFKKLLKSDSQNRLYKFKITEKPIGTETNVYGYKTPNYDVTAGDSNAKRTIETAAALGNNGSADWDGNHSLTMTMDITNELDTRDITVAKVWNDNGYGGDVGNDIAKELHYDLALSLSGTIKGAASAQDKPLHWKVGNDTKTTETYVLAKDSDYAVKFIGFPKYDKEGNDIVYTVSESKNTSGEEVASGDNLTNVIAAIPADTPEVDPEEFTSPGNDDRKYGYVGTCQKITTNNTTGDTQYTITNTLPLTAVKVTKHWDDSTDIDGVTVSDYFGLRPSKINDINKGEAATDAIELTLSRKSTENDYGQIENKSDTNRSQHYTEWYVSTDADKVTPVDDKSADWTYTYRKLLKYDIGNAAYEFKIDEAKVNAYKDPQYVNQTITAVEVNKPNTTADEKQNAWDGEYPLVQEFDITNELDTRDIIVTKTWLDDNNSNSTRYDLAITLSNDKTSNTETKYIARDETRYLIFKKLPKYYKDGTQIKYKVTEAYCADMPSTLKDADYVSSKFTGGTGRTETDITSDAAQFAVASRRYNYSGSCKKVTVGDTVGQTNYDIVMEFDITNKLPMVTFEVHKVWTDDKNRDYYRPTSVSFTLRRKVVSTDSVPVDTTNLDASETVEYSAVNSLEGEDRTAKYKSTDTLYWTATFGKYPQYSINNYLYDYDVEENNPDNYTKSERYVLSEDTDLTDDTQILKKKNYTFTNTHEVKEQSLTVEKTWEDSEFKATTRPEDLSKIKVQLWCKYTRPNGSSYDDPVSSDTDAQGVKAHIDAAVTNYSYEVGLDKFDENGDYKFDHLPVYVNLNGSAVENGTNWQAVTYYVKEILDENTAKNYDDYYSAPASSSAEKDFQTTAAVATGTNLLKTSTLDHNTEDKTIYVENRLITRDITVDKTWADNGFANEDYCKENLHYDINVTLACDSLLTTVVGRNVSGKYSETKKIEKEKCTNNSTPQNADQSITFSGLPKYNRNGDLLEYTIIEAVNGVSEDSAEYKIGTRDNNDSEAENYYNITVTNHKFGYVGSCTCEKDSDGIVEKLHITNTLPLTGVTVIKHWEDAVDNIYDGYLLRPTVSSNYHDPLQLKLETKELGSREAWGAPKGDATGNQDAVVSSQKDTWTYTYTKLLKYSENNTLYTFRITEGTQVNGYKSAQYCQPNENDNNRQTITNETLLETLPANKSWDGTAAITTPMEITNRLDTRNIIVTKTWDDTDYDTTQEELHYDLSVNLKGTIKGTGTNADSPLKIRTSTAPDGTDYDVTKVLGKDAVVENTTTKYKLKFADLPKYDSEGNVIKYSITEEKAPANSSASTDDYTIDTVTVTGNRTKKDTDGAYGHFDQINAATNNQYGYKGSCEYIVNYDDDIGVEKKYVEQFDITNTLPVTYLKVNKSWTVAPKYHNKPQTDVTFDLTRSVKNARNEDEEDTAFKTTHTCLTVQLDSSSATIPKESLSYPPTDSDPSYLVYDRQNKQYTYKVEEHHVDGYVTTYDPQTAAAVSTDKSDENYSPQQMNITNTEITGTAKFQKIDYTYYKTHKGEPGYDDRKLSGVKFELYIKAVNSVTNYTEIIPVPVTPVTGASGKYEFDYETANDPDWASDPSLANTSTTPNVVESPADGTIEIDGLPLNTYFLKEIDPVPSAYVKNDAEFSFEVKVGESDVNESETVYSAISTKTHNGYTDIFSDEGFITHKDELAKIGNEEQKRRIKLTKKDATDDSVLEKASYYLLYLIPHQVNNVTYPLLDNYLQAAKDAIIQSGGSLTNEVKEFWRVRGVYQTDSHGVLAIKNELMHGVYTLLEVQAPVGYDIDCDGFDSVSYTMVENAPEETDPDMLLLTLDETHVFCEVIHKDPRKSANVKIYKQDEYENPLNGAVFELWYDPVKPQPEPPNDPKTATITPRSDRDYIYFRDVKTESNYISYNGKTLDEGYWITHPTYKDFNDGDNRVRSDNHNDTAGLVDAYTDSFQMGNYHVWAKFFNSLDEEIGDREVTEVYADENDVGTFKILPPDGAVQVQFYLKRTFIDYDSNNPTYHDIALDHEGTHWGIHYAPCITEKIHFTLGEGYERTGERNDDQTEKCGTWALSTNEQNLGKTTTPMYPTDNKVVIHRNHTKNWDDLHICFYKEDGNGGYTVVGQAEPGYMMEPYGDGTGDWGTYFELTIPDGATYFRVNNGTKGTTANTNRRYWSEYTQILDQPNYQNGGNYYEFQNANDTDYENLTLVQWSSGIPENRMGSSTAALSDYDYIYFTCPDGWIDEDHTHLYAYYNGGTLGDHSSGVYCTSPGVMDDGYFKNSDGVRVYRFKTPRGASGSYNYVQFNNGKNASKSQNILYTLGTIYTATAPAQVLAGEATQNYTPVESTASSGSNYDRKYIYFVADIPKDADGTRNKWDDIHVVFTSDAEGNTVPSGLQSSPGYIAEYIGTYTDADKSQDRKYYPAGDWYRIPIPNNSDAKYFTLNNGNAVVKDSRAASSQTYEIVKGGVYYFDDTNASQTPMTLKQIWNPDNANLSSVDASEPNVPFKIAEVVTGDNGLNGYIRWLKPQTKDGETYDPDNPSTYIENIVDKNYIDNDYEDIGTEKDVKVVKWGTYFWQELEGPIGYTPKGTTEPFEIGREEADKAVYVKNAKNEPIKGSVVLIKTAQEKVGTFNIGDPVPGARFNLYKVGDPDPVKIGGDSVDGYYADNASSNIDMVTNSPNGQITISNLEWGQYYLKEAAVPNQKFKLSDKEIHFTVGRNMLTQEVSFKNTALKAKLNITKNIYERTDAWGDPTFIFKIRQVGEFNENGEFEEISDPGAQRVRTVSLTLDGDKKTRSTNYFNVDPGRYIVTEVNVSRYEFKSVKIVKPYNVSDTNTNNKAAEFTISGNGSADVVFDNTLKYYDKFSHVDAEVNHFDKSYKGIRVEYDDVIIPDEYDRAQISKSALKLYKIMSSGEEVEVKDEAEKNALIISYVPGANDDQRFGNEDFNGNADGEKITIDHVSRYTDGVYTLRATDTNNFTCDFNISFVSKNGVPKIYQKTFIFRADTDNRSYFVDEGVRTSQYEFTFTMVADGESYKPYYVKHNGIVVAYGADIETLMNDALEDMNDNAFQVSEAYIYDAVNNRAGVEFDKWNDGTDDYTIAQINYDKLSELAADNSSNVTFTAFLAVPPSAPEPEP